jgi:hypothetical protein
MGSVASATIASGQAELMRRRPARLSSPRSGFAGFWYSPEVITLAVRHWAVRWYLRFGLSYRDVEELLAERGVDVDHVTVWRWVRRFTPLLTEAARPCRHAVGDRWWVDETGLLHRREADEISGVLARSDGVSEFGEDRCEPMPSIDIPAEFVVSATKILHERVPGTDHPCRAQPF